MKALNREILRLALPSILANLTVPLVGMVDIAVAGHLDTSAAALIGGISVGSLMFDMLYWNFGFLRAGTGGMTAQAYGRESPEDCAAILRRGLRAALLLSALVLLVQWPFQQLMRVSVHSSEEVWTLAIKYFHIRIWAAPATLTLPALRGWFIGMQDTFSSMLTDLVVNGVNIVGSIVLALGLPLTGWDGFGYGGIAWGTLLAQYSGLAVASVILTVKYRDVLRSTGGTEAAGGSVPFRTFFTVNRDLFIRSLCLMAVYLSFTALAARMGDTLLAMCSIMMKLMMIFSYFTDGFAYAGEALTGRYIGSRNPRMVRQTIRWTFIWSMGIGFLFIGIYAAGGIPMFRLMTSDNTVVDAARTYIPWLVLIPLLGCPAFTWDGIYIGATATRQMRDANFGCLCTFYLVWFLGIWLFRPAAPGKVHVLFAAYYAHLLFRSLYQTALYKKAVLER